MPVSFYYQIPSFNIKNKKKLVQWILSVAFIENREIEKLDFIFCDDGFLTSLNKKFLRHNTFTDIITFDDSKEKKITAEIYISIQRVEENSTYFKVGSIQELHRVMIHGVLHCCGYNDKSDKEKRQMRKKEDWYLRLLEEM